MDRLQYNELALEAMRWAAVRPATLEAVANVNRCVEEMQKLRGYAAPPVDRRGQSGGAEASASGSDGGKSDD